MNERILVTGDRNWTDETIIGSALTGYLIVAHGGARGADKLAGAAMKVRNIEPQVWEAEWEKYGKPAGVLRNQKMLDEFKPTKVFAFHDDLEHSKGTKDMVNRAKKAGVPVKLFSHEHPEGIDL